jgi:nitrogen fixation protein FixH
MNPTSPKRSLWPLALFATFAVFISGVATLVTIAVHSDEDLVREDYYEQEVHYQQQIDRELRTARIGPELRVAYDAATAKVTLNIPAAHASRHATGSVKFYRPSDARLDRTVPLQVNAAGEQQFDARDLKNGLWKLRVTWQVNGEEYYSDNAIDVRHGNS